MTFANLFFEGVETRTPRPSLRPRPPSVEEVSQEGGTFLSSLLERTGLPRDHYRRRALARRLPACMRFLGAPTVQDALRQIEADPTLAQATLNVVLLGVTQFFRDEAVFETMRRSILPAMLVRVGRPRIWSAACSDGQEMYSVAMLLAEAGGLGRCELLGTDRRSEAIENARLGVFSKAATDSLGAHWREAYFATLGESLIVGPALRGAIDWKTADLFASVEAGPWHMILWRNMAIYLEQEASEQIWTRLCGVLAPLGYLIVGNAEDPPKHLPLVRVAKCIYRKRPSSS